MSPKRLAPALLCAAMASCASYHLVQPTTPPLDVNAPPPEGLARVCVLRPHRDVAAVTFAVRDNGELVGATRGSGYFCYHGEPGEHHLTTEVEGRTTETWLSLAAGRSYYVSQLVQNTFQQVDLELRLLDEAEGRKELQGRPYRMLVTAPGGAAPAQVPVARARPSAGAHS